MTEIHEIDRGVSVSDAMTSSSASQLRLLVLSPGSGQAGSGKEARPSPIPAFLEQLTSTKPSEDIQNFAGYTTHSALHLKTKYYEKDVTIWCDELSPPSASDKAATSKQQDTDPENGDTLEEWKEQMLSEPASEVRAVIGGIVLLLSLPSQPRTISDDTLQYIQTVNSLREAIEDEGGGRDVAAAIVIQPAIANHDAAKEAERYMEVLEEKCHDDGIFGWDFISCYAQPGIPDDEKQSESREKTGQARVVEVLEAVDWSMEQSHSAEDHDYLADDDLTPNIIGDPGFAPLDAELTREMMALKMSMQDKASGESTPAKFEGDGEDIPMDQMSELMSRVVAIRNAGADMPAAERQKFARREVEKIVKELG